VVVELVVTTIDSVGSVVVVDDVDERPAPPLRRTPSMVKPPEESAVTLPDAKAKLAKLPPPLGNDPPPGVSPPVGGVPPVPPPNRPPRRPPPPKPPAAVVQLPLESGDVMTTLVAVTGPVVDPDVAGDPVAVTQSPTATFEAAAVTVWVNVVDDVQLTVTCPLSGFWTSIDVPVMAATVPDAPGWVGRVGTDVDVDDEAALGDALELHAAAANESALSTAITGTAARPRRM
jgi:hypothetical protein